MLLFACSRLCAIVSSFITETTFFMSHSFHERPSDFGGLPSAILQFPPRKRLAFTNEGTNFACQSVYTACSVYPSRIIVSTRIIVTRAQTPSPKVPARVKILARGDSNFGRADRLHYKFYPSRTLFSGTCANFTQTVPNIFCSFNGA